MSLKIKGGGHCYRRSWLFKQWHMKSFKERGWLPRLRKTKNPTKENEQKNKRRYHRRLRGLNRQTDNVSDCVSVAWELRGIVPLKHPPSPVVCASEATWSTQSWKLNLNGTTALGLLTLSPNPEVTLSCLIFCTPGNSVNNGPLNSSHGRNSSAALLSAGKRMCCLFCTDTVYWLTYCLASALF